jgi:CHAD domain-containing protein
MAGTYLEREQKYNVEPSFSLPSLDEFVPAGGRLDTLVIHLESLYFDTADGHLRRHGVTLRRRTGDADEGWQAKLPSGTDKTEVQLPLESAEDSPPPALLELTTGLRRGRPMQKVATLRTERTAHRILDGDGRQLVEVADDTVHGSALGDVALVSQWREVEVELGAGPDNLPDAIGARLQQAGARPAANWSKLARALRPSGPLADDAAPPALEPTASVEALLVSFLEQQRASLIDADLAMRREQDATERAELAVFRLRAVLRCFGDLFEAGRTGGADSELAWYGGLLGAVRDPELLRKRLIDAVAALPVELVLGPVVRRIDQHLVGERERHREALRAAMNGTRYFALLDEVDRLVDAPPLTVEAGQPAASLIGGLKRAQREAVTGVGAAVTAESDVTVARAYRAVGRARTAAEVLGPAEAKAAKRSLKRASKVQDGLRELQQSGAAAALLLRLGARAGTSGGENGFTFGLLYEREQQHARRARAEVAKRAARLAQRR